MDFGAIPDGADEQEKSMDMIFRGSRPRELAERMRRRLFRFPVYYNTACETDIEVLDLKVRAYNCLKRAGIETVEQLIERIDSSSDLLQIKNLGRNSAVEIMEKLFWYNYERLSCEKCERFLEEVRRLNHEV